MQDLIQAILDERDFERKKGLFKEIYAQIADGGKQVAAMLKPLLMDDSAEIRRETAFLLDYWGIDLAEKEGYQFLFAIQDMGALKKFAEHNSTAREIYIQGMRDRNVRVREKMLRHFHLSDCRTDGEKAVYFYCRGDYTALIQMSQDDGMVEFIVNLLSEGLRPDRNTPYHQRQCQMTLQQLGFLAEEMPRKKNKSGHIEKVDTPPPLAELARTPLQQFLDRLNKNGLLVEGKRIYPEIHQVAVTNRITYKNPGVQGWSQQKRVEKIQPPEGMSLYSYDFKEIEPRLLFNFMIQNFWISYDDVAVEDFYLLFNPTNRKQGKKMLNRLINGGGIKFMDLDESVQKIVEAIQEFRMELVESARSYGYVETLAGHHLYISPDEKNFNGKAMNRLIQGSASDFFNDAVVSLQAYIDLEDMPVQILLLLYDEVWVAVEKNREKQLSQEIENFLNRVSQRWYLPIPISVVKEKIRESP